MDASYTNTVIPLSLYEHLGILAYKYNLDFQTFKSLAEWLEVYEYVLPKDRKLDPLLVQYCIQYRTIPITSNSVFRGWLLCDLYTSCYTLQEQINITRYIRSAL